MTAMYIIAAGLGTRMGNINVPKALLHVNGTENVMNTINKSIDLVDKIYIVGNKMMESAWADFYSRIRDKQKIQLVLISSGLGDGHAVMSALEATVENAEDVIIVWGDAYFENSETFLELVNFDSVYGAAPVVLEHDPYVSFLVNHEMKVVSADFAKNGEKHATGFHDQSIFKFNKELLEASLKVIHNTTWKNGRYVSDTGEMTFLYVLHYLYNCGKAITAYPTEYLARGYNTNAELNAINSHLVIPGNC